MQLDIISPEAQLFSGQVEAVQFPGLDGSFQVLKDHAPIISALKSGIVSVRLTSKIEKPEKLHKSISVDNSQTTLSVSINGGVMEMQNNKVILLAE